MDKTELFEKMPVPRALLKLCIPTMLSSLVLILYNLADTFFVGMLNAPAQTAGITLVSPLTLGFIAITNLFGVGGSSMMSRSLGSKDYEAVKRSSAFAFYGALFSAVIIAVVLTMLKSPVLRILGTDSVTSDPASGYMFWTVTVGTVPSIANIVMSYLVRAEGASLHASIGTMTGCILNIILDPLFILPGFLNMGAAGAGCATLIGHVVACLYYFILLRVKRGRTYVCLNIRMFSFSRYIMKNVFSVGVPAMLQNLLNVIGITLLNNFTASFGEQAVAAMGIASKLQMIPININVGMTQGSMPIFGYNYASGDIKRLKKCVRFSLALTVSVIAVICLVFIIFSGDLVRAFMDNDTVVGYGSWFLTAMCIAMPFMCVDYSAVGVFQGCGMGSKAFVFAILRKVVLEIPALIILSRLFPLYGIPFAQCFAEIIMAVLSVIMLLRVFRKISVE